MTCGQVQIEEAANVDENATKELIRRGYSLSDLGNYKELLSTMIESYIDPNYVNALYNKSLQFNLLGK
jgi:hypothetical protein